MYTVSYIVTFINSDTKFSIFENKYNKHCYNVVKKVAQPLQFILMFFHHVTMYSKQSFFFLEKDISYKFINVYRMKKQRKL